MIYMMTLKQSQWAFRKLSGWLDNRSWQVQFKSKAVDAAYYDTKTIVINRCSTSEHQIFTLLHECGHLLSGGKQATIDRLWVSKQTKKTDWHRVMCVMDEVRAWDAGERLAYRLGIYIDRTRYAAYRARYLKKYFKWAITAPKNK